MTNEIYRVLDNLRYKLHHKHFRDGTSNRVRNLGCNILTVCWKGEGRSPFVAEIATRQKIPTIALGGGLKLLDGYENDLDLLSAINAFPYIYAILDQEEAIENSSQLSLLDVSKRFHDESIALQYIISTFT